MANYIDDPVMGLVIPVAGQRPGEQYATDISNDLQLIANHTHTGEANLDGYQIPSAGINIDDDLSFQSNNATSLRSTRFISQSGAIGGVGDLDCVYVANGELYYNDANGNSIQLTSNGSINTSITNYFSVHTTTTNYTINSTDGYAVIDCTYTVPTANKTITLPLISDVQPGRFFFIKDGFGVAGTVNITITPSGGDTIDVQPNHVMDSDWDTVLVISDGISNWLLFPFVLGKMSASVITVESTGGAMAITAATTITETAAQGMTLKSTVNALTLEATANNININTGTFLDVNVATSMTVDTVTSLTNTIGTSLTNTVGTTLTTTAGTGISQTATTGNVSLVATAGTATLTAGSGAATITGSTNATLTGTSGDVTITAGNSFTMTGTNDGYIAAQDSLTLAGFSVTMKGALYLPTKAVTTSPYTVDHTTQDVLIYVDSTGGAISINLPAASNGRFLIIQDVGGVANTNNITLVRNGSDTIQGVGADYVMDADYQGVQLAAYSGGSWFIVGTH